MHNFFTCLFLSFVSHGLIHWMQTWITSLTQAPVTQWKSMLLKPLYLRISILFPSTSIHCWSFYLFILITTLDDLFCLRRRRRYFEERMTPFSFPLIRPDHLAGWTKCPVIGAIRKFWSCSYLYACLRWGGSDRPFKQTLSFVVYTYLLFTISPFRISLSRFFFFSSTHA